MAGRLADKVAVVTGGARGMGAAEAELFVAEGAHVFIADVNDADGKSLAKRLGDSAEYLHHDVGEQGDWVDLVEHVRVTRGGVDILVNNAGVSRSGGIDDFSWDDFDVMVRVNQRGVLLGMQAVLASMRSRGAGSIVNIASGAALRGWTGLLVYSGTKFAVRGMSQAAAAELAKDNIRVNVVHPGCIDTPMHQQNPAETQEKLLARIPMNRFGKPTDVAAMALFLASDESSYITGSDFAVDGGILLS